jgi:hypothetical protein
MRYKRNRNKIKWKEEKMDISNIYRHSYNNYIEEIKSLIMEVGSLKYKIEKLEKENKEIRTLIKDMQSNKE